MLMSIVWPISRLSVFLKIHHAPSSAFLFFAYPVYKRSQFFKFRGKKAGNFAGHDRSRIWHIWQQSPLTTTTTYCGPSVKFKGAWDKGAANSKILALYRNSNAFHNTDGIHKIWTKFLDTIVMALPVNRNESQCEMQIQIQLGNYGKKNQMCRLFSVTD